MTNQSPQTSGGWLGVGTGAENAGFATLWLAAIVESSDDAIVGKDLAGIIRSWNRSAERIFGYTRDEVIGKHISILIPEDRQYEEPSILKRLRRGERIEHFETVRRRKDGRLIDTSLTISPIRDAGGNIVGASKIARDVTEIKAVQKSAVRLNRVLVSLLETFPDILYIVGRDLRVQLMNPAAMTFSHHAGIGGDLPGFVAEHVRQVIETGQELLPQAYEHVQRVTLRGRLRYLLPRVMAMRHTSGEIFGAAVMLQDITEFRMLDEVKTDMLATVSHEIKTPLTSLRLAILMLLEKAAGPLNERQEELLTMAHNDGDRLLQTLNLLLDITRFEVGVPELILERTLPSALTEPAISDMREAAAAKRLKLGIQIQRNLPFIEWDLGRMQHVLANLLGNAIKYSPPGSEIDVRVGLLDEQHLRIIVEDAGPGIPGGLEERIFERFFRIPGSAAPGAGLGLFIAKLFVQAHGGTIAVKNRPTGGSKFTVVLPLAQPKKSGRKGS